MPRTTSLGIQTPTASDQHPSEQWWSALGATTTAAIESSVGSLSEAVKRDYVTRAEAAEFGIPGPPNSLRIGSVTSGVVPFARVMGDAPDQTLDLSLPLGPRGPEGPGGAFQMRETAEAGLFEVSDVQNSTVTAAVAVAMDGKVIPDGTDINTIRATGTYVVPTTSAARTMVNWPTIRAGTMEVRTRAGSSLTTQHVTAYVSTTAEPEQYVRATLLASSWPGWFSSGWSKGVLPNGTDLGTWRNPGVYGITALNTALTMTGLPTDANGNTLAGPGSIETMPTAGSGRTLQRLTMEIDGRLRVFARTTGLVASFPEWQEIGAPPAAGAAAGAARVADVHVSDHASRVEIARARRGGSIGTGGRAVFMWRFDHWLVAFRDKILPILREFDLPATLNVNHDNMGIVANGSGTIPWSEVQDWNQADGIEIANHGSTHTNANTMETIHHEIVGGRRNLEKAMPRVAVETWQEHGSAYLVANDLAGDEGLNLGRTPEAFTQSYAGRLVMAEHAIVEGKFGSFYPPLTGHPQVAQSHYSMDRQTSAESIDTIAWAQKTGRGLTGYTHPGLMDQVNIGGSIYEATRNLDGSVDLAWDGGRRFDSEAALRTWAADAGHIVHMTTGDFREICRWLAAERDAGRLMVMTAAGGGFADASHDRRENLLLTDLSDWSSTAGWSQTGQGEDQVWSADSSAIRLTQSMLLYTRFGWAMGAAHELVARVKASTDTELMLRMEQTGDPANWVTSKTYAVPGDGQIREYRLNLTLPRDRSITQMTVYVGGASMEIHGPPVLAAI